MHKQNIIKNAFSYILMFFSFSVRERRWFRFLNFEYSILFILVHFFNLFGRYYLKADKGGTKNFQSFKFLIFHLGKFYKYSLLKRLKNTSLLLEQMDEGVWKYVNDHIRVFLYLENAWNIRLYFFFLSYTMHRYFFFKYIYKRCWNTLRLLFSVDNFFVEGERSLNLYLDLV